MNGWNERTNSMVAITISRSSLPDKNCRIPNLCEYWIKHNHGPSDHSVGMAINMALLSILEMKSIENDSFAL